MSIEKSNNRKFSGGFAALPYHIFRANCTTRKPAAVSSLSHSAFHLLINLASQLNGKNNGDLSAAPKIMALYGWSSKGTLATALAELRERGFIELTRQGGRNKCNLYAVTWLAIDECKGKLDIGETRVPSNLWKKEK